VLSTSRGHLLLFPSTRDLYPPELYKFLGLLGKTAFGFFPSKGVEGKETDLLKALLCVAIFPSSNLTMVESDSFHNASGHTTPSFLPPKGEIEPELGRSKPYCS